MNDERLKSNIRNIKRNNIFIMMGFSIFVILLNLRSVDFLSFIWTQSFVLISSLLVLFIVFVYTLLNKIEDERVEQNILRIYNYGFNIIVFGALAIHFITSLYNGTIVGYGSNSFITISAFILFVSSLISVRKNNMTFNYQFIELDRKQYYLTVLKRILYLFIYFIIISVILFILGHNMDYYIAVQISIIISFINISIIYFLFSIYERFHSVEQIEIDEGKRRYISQKAILLIGIITYFGLWLILKNTVMLLSSYGIFDFRIDSILYIILYVVINNYQDYIIFPLILNLIMYYSITKINLNFPKTFKYLKWIIWLGFAFSFVNYLYTSFTTLIFAGLDEEAIISIANIYSGINVGVTIISWLVNGYILMFLFKNKIQVYKLYALRLAVKVIGFGIHLLADDVIASLVINSILVILTMILSIIIIYRLSHTYQIAEDIEDDQDTVKSSAETLSLQST